MRGMAAHAECGEVAQTCVVCAGGARGRAAGRVKYVNVAAARLSRRVAGDSSRRIEEHVKAHLDGVH